MSITYQNLSKILRQGELHKNTKLLSIVSVNSEVRDQLLAIEGAFVKCLEHENKQRNASTT